VPSLGAGNVVEKNVTRLYVLLVAMKASSRVLGLASALA